MAILGLKGSWNKLRIYLFILIINLFFMTLSCSDSRSNGDGSIIYWSSNNSDEITYANKIIQRWNKLHPEKPIKFQPVPEGQSSEEVVLAAVVGETTPDIYSNMWQGDVELYAQAKKLIALDSIPGFIEFLYERCDSEVVKEITSTDGHIYQIPWKINPIMMIYNKKIFEKIGYSNPPKNYSEFFDAAKKIKASQGELANWMGYVEVDVTWWQRFFDFYPLYLAASGGASLIKDNKVAFNNEYAVQIFSFLKTLYDNRYFPREKISARQDPFLSGNIAIRFTGPWEIVHANRFKPEGFEFDFSFLPVPDNKPSGHSYTYGDTKNIVLFNTCKDKLAAWEFIKLMISPENDLLLLSTTNQLPRRGDLTTNKLFVDFFNNNPQMLPFAQQAKYVRGPDNSPVLKEVFDLISQQYEACVVFGKKSPQQAINDAAQAVSLLLLK